MPHDPTAVPPPEGAQSESEEAEGEAAMQQEEAQALQLQTAAEEGQAPAAAAPPAAAPQAGAAGPAGAAPGRSAAVIRQISHASEAAARMQAHADPEEPPPAAGRRRTSIGGVGLSLHKRWVAAPAPAVPGYSCRMGLLGTVCLGPSIPAQRSAAATHPCCAGGPAASLAEGP